LDGGPGGHTLAAADSLVQSFAPILRHRDVILFDQRGVGYSQPALDCPELQAAELATIEQDLDPAEQNANHLAALAACRDRLTAAGINLAAYHSAASAADLDALRRALGYDTWNLFGISYGTRLALTALRDYGDTGTIRSAVLDSVYPPQVDSQAILGPNAARALSLLFARCAADAACSAAYPNLETRFYALVDRLNAEPTPVVITDRQNRTTYRVPFNGDDLLETMFGMMYDANQIIQLPRMVAHLEQNRKTAVANWLTNGLYLTESAGMATSVQCTEEYPFASQAAFEANLADLPPQIAQWMAAYAAPLTGCDVWQVPAADPRENEPVRSDVPTLLLAGDYDPITPPDGARETAAHLSHAYYFEFAGQSHGVARHSCGIALVIAFLDQPDASPDAGCLERLYFGFITE
ncbi:MAG: alpha/beta fold hydrolase, partial [Anaerolineales bacterium]|nr:alpha/beta fold hydrolase [Anaerolineales bacterium]